MRTRVFLPIIGLLICIVAGNLVFIDQAFHMDDSIYLLLARNIARSPLFPQDVPTYFEGLYVPDLASTEHPLPLTSYWMRVIGHIGRGLSEVNLHFGFLIFPMTLACSMYALSHRFTGHPLLAALTLMFLPVVYVLSHTVMTDIPQLALAVAATALFGAGLDFRRPLLVWLAAFMATLASFVSYGSLCLIPLLSLWAIRRKERSAVAILMIVPTVLFGSWLTLSYFHYQRLPPAHLFDFYFVAKKVLSAEFVLRKSIYNILVIGAVTIFPLSLLLLARKRLIAMSLLFVYPAIWISGALPYSLPEKTLFVVFFCAGFVTIAEFVRALLSRDEADRFLGVWFLGILLFGASVYMTGAARYLLLAAPPLVLLFLRRLERTLTTRRFRQAAIANLIFGATMAFLISRADYQFAGMYRDFASTFQRSHPTGTQEVWFNGEWGFRAYLETAGAKALGRRDARPQPGDMLAVATLATPYDTLFDDRIGLDSIVLVAPSRVRFPAADISVDSVFEFTVGMPLEKSDGVNLSIGFESLGMYRQLRSEMVGPEDGNRWLTRRIPLNEVAGKEGTLVLSADVAGDSNADWISIARARIWDPVANRETAPYDLLEHFKEARIEPVAGMQYDTPENVPVFPMTVWLRQESNAILRGVYDYRPRLSVRLLDARAHAGFWSMNWGMLPFSFATGDEPLESIRVYEITRTADAYGETTLAWYNVR